MSGSNSPSNLKKTTPRRPYFFARLIFWSTDGASLNETNRTTELVVSAAAIDGGRVEETRHVSAGETLLTIVLVT